LTKLNEEEREKMVEKLEEAIKGGLRVLTNLRARTPTNQKQDEANKLAGE